MAIDYYEVLGVRPDADADQIKRQYRALVRQYHPDIATDKEAAHARMQLILEAWNVLSDPAQRARYDRERQPTSMPRSGAPPGAGQGPLSSRMGGAGQTTGPVGAPSPAYQQPGSQQPGYQQRPGASGGGAQTRIRFATMVFDAAQLYFSEGRAKEAIRICEQVMQADSSNAEAPALLGDIYTEQGHLDQARRMYERAMQLQPHNILYRQKWDALKRGDAASVTATIRAGYSSHAKTKRVGCGAQMLLWLGLIGLLSWPIAWIILLIL
ncbi:MAG: DnaJ domain-containing protein [Armatimonadota bacterium]|nr:DnaJ domain-containing protein [Armatimonadota bacterium]